MLRNTLAAALCAALSPAAWACPTCSCADYTLTLMGAEKAFAGRTRLAADFQHRSEYQGSGAGRTRLEESRFILGGSHSPTADLSLAARVPFSGKTAESAALAREEGSGLGDVELLGRYALGHTGELTARHLWGVQLGTRVPTSSEQHADDGGAIDIDAQPGTGQWAPSAGLWYGYFRWPVAVNLTVADVRPVGTGYQGLEQGNAVIATATSQYAFDTQWTAQLGLESRFAARNRFDGVADADSGGTAAFLVPGLVYSPDGNWIFYLAGQLPVVEDLNGEQEERGDIRIGLAFDLPAGGES